jgi:large subunit ribosomal protein L15
MAKKMRRVHKMRGSRENGRGRKKGRGSGLRGGKGNAGSFGHKYVHYLKTYGPRYFGKHGFKRPQSIQRDVRAVNVGDLERLAHQLEKEGLVRYEGNVAVVDLAAAGYDKLLGGGTVHRAYKVRVASATAGATEKLGATGGSIEEPVEA